MQLQGGVAHDFVGIFAREQAAERHELPRFGFGDMPEQGQRDALQRDPHRPAFDVMNFAAVNLPLRAFRRERQARFQAEFRQHGRVAAAILRKRLAQQRHLSKNGVFACHVAAPRFEIAVIEGVGAEAPIRRISAEIEGGAAVGLEFGENFFDPRRADVGNGFVARFERLALFVERFGELDEEKSAVAAVFLIQFKDGLRGRAAAREEI